MDAIVWVRVESDGNNITFESELSRDHIEIDRFRVKEAGSGAGPLRSVEGSLGLLAPATDANVGKTIALVCQLSCKLALAALLHLVGMRIGPR